MSPRKAIEYHIVKQHSSLYEGVKLGNIYLLLKRVTGGNLISTLNDSFTVSFGSARKKIMENEECQSKKTA